MKKTAQPYIVLVKLATPGSSKFKTVASKTVKHAAMSQCILGLHFLSENPSNSKMAAKHSIPVHR